MKRFSPHPYSVSLSYYVIGATNFPTLTCAGCRGSLDVHQPDPNHPDRILGTCSDCGRWYRVGFQSNGAELVVLDLPDLTDVGASRTNPDKGDKS